MCKSLPAEEYGVANDDVAIEGNLEKDLLVYESVALSVDISECFLHITEVLVDDVENA